MNKTDKLPALMLFPVLGEKKVNEKQVIDLTVLSKLLE